MLNSPKKENWGGPEGASISAIVSAEVECCVRVLTCDAGSVLAKPKTKTCDSFLKFQIWIYQ